MNPLTEFYLFTALIWGSLIAGLGWRWRDASVARWTAPLLQFNAITFPLLGFFVGFWHLDVAAHGWRLALVPLVATLGSIATLYLARAVGKRRRLGPREYGAFVLSAAISNIGLTFGMPLCFALYGLDGFAFAGLYVLYFPFFVYIVLFTFADRMQRVAAGHDTTEDSPLRIAADFFRDPFRTLPILAIVAGLGMNAAFGREAIPGWLKSANHGAIYLSLVNAFLAVGFTVHAHGLRRHAGEIGALCGIKFVFTPLVAVLIGWAIGFTGEPLRILAIEGACPVAIFSVMTAAIYDLDQDLAGASLIVTTALATVGAFAGLMLFHA